MPNKNCKIGYTCGWSCISQVKECLNALGETSSKLAQWLKDHGGSKPSAPSAEKEEGLFSPGALKNLIGLKVKGASSDEMRQQMVVLAKATDPKQVEPVMRVLAKLRGRDFEDMMGDFERFQKLKADRPDNPPDLAPVHASFMGSTTQLRYGKVVGDALGIDPVFGALLNPTGGLVGPGNAGFDGGETPVGYHGVVHDAAGYLFNYHKLGPGYDYLGREGRDTSSPLSGQRSGIQYWRQAMGGSVGSVGAELVMRGVVGGVDIGVRIRRRA